MNETSEMWRDYKSDLKEFRDHEETDQVARLHVLRDSDLLCFDVLNKYHYRIWTADRPQDTVDFWPRTSSIRHHNRRIEGGWVALMRILGISTLEWMT